MKSNTKGFSAIILIILVALVVGFLVYFFFGRIIKVNNSKLNEESSIKSTQESEMPEVAKVLINKDGFYPATIVIKSGTRVSWENQDSKTHRVVSDPHPTHTILPDLDSQQDISSGDFYTFTFNKKGEFAYHDHLNPLKFKGIVVVE